MTQLWSNTYGKYQQHNNKIIKMIDELIEFIDDNDNKHNANQSLINLLYSHPFGKFDTNQGYIYMNRVCYRVSDDISNYYAKGAKKKRKLQRCLAPHLDSCPHDLFGENRDKLGIKNMERWRPIQLFVALTDNHVENTGGFECVKGFHRKFAQYFKQKTNVSKIQKDMKDTVCVGDFCRLLPNEDKEILSQYQHIKYEAGSLILFDWRIPHANARYNKSNNTRMVVYTGLLPNVELNRKYSKLQLEHYYDKKVPPDFWGSDNYSDNKDNIVEMQFDPTYQFSELGEKLMGIKPW